MSHPDFQHIGAPEVKVIEEVGELLQAIGKARRFGFETHHPERPDSNNRQEIIEEISDLINVLNDYKMELLYTMAIEDGIISNIMEIE